MILYLAGRVSGEARRFLRDRNYQHVLLSFHTFHHGEFQRLVKRKEKTSGPRHRGK